MAHCPRLHAQLSIALASQRNSMPTPSPGSAWRTCAWLKFPSRTRWLSLRSGLDCFVLSAQLTAHPVALMSCLHLSLPPSPTKPRRICPLKSDQLSAASVVPTLSDDLGQTFNVCCPSPVSALCLMAPSLYCVKASLMPPENVCPYGTVL